MVLDLNYKLRCQGCAGWAQLGLDGWGGDGKEATQPFLKACDPQHEQPA